MKKWLFTIIEIAVVVALLVTSFNFGRNMEKIEYQQEVQEESMEIELLEEEEKYPMDERGTVDNAYMIEVLKKKSKGESLEWHEDDLISYFCIQDGGHGIAWVDVQGIGMQSVKSKFFETADYGKSWNILENSFSTNSGAQHCTYIGEHVILMNYAEVVTETTVHISRDRGHSFEIMEVGQIVDFCTPDFDKRLFPEVLYVDRVNETVVYGWKYGDYDAEGYLLVAEYDADLNMVNEIYRDSTAIEIYLRLDENGNLEEIFSDSNLRTLTQEDVRYLMTFEKFGKSFSEMVFLAVSEIEQQKNQTEYGKNNITFLNTLIAQN